MINQKVIPAISDFKKLNRFLNSDLEFGILMNFHLAQLESLVEAMKKNKKKVLVHSELIKGLATDEYGAIYLIQSLKVDGIISSKPKVIEVCKKRNVLGIYRFFIKDTISLDQSIEIGKRLKPDFVEILPAACYDLVSQIENDLRCKVLMGGLIQNEELIHKCFDAGAIAITTSKPEFWDIR